MLVRDKFTASPQNPQERKYISITSLIVKKLTDSLKSKKDIRLDQKQRDEISEDVLKTMCKQAQVDCLNYLHDHCKSYFCQTEPVSLSFEHWIKKCHPENVKMGLVDKRFYYRESAHRIIWNSHCDMLYHSELKIPFTISDKTRSIKEDEKRYRYKKELQQ